MSKSPVYSRIAAKHPAVLDLVKENEQPKVAAYSLRFAPVTVVVRKA